VRDDLVSSTLQVISDCSSIQADAVSCVWESVKGLKSLEDYQPLVQVLISKYLYRQMNLSFVKITSYLYFGSGLLLVCWRIW